jgi:seryl-tRNA synthetase
MIDLGLLREQPEKIIALIKKKEPSFDAQGLAHLDNQQRSLRTEVESLRAEKNELARQGKSGITPELRERSIHISKQLKEKEALLEEVDVRFKELYLSCPNLIFDDVPAGNKESNTVVKEYGAKKSYDFHVKNHVELGNALGWFDFNAAVTMTGSNFVLYKGDAVRYMYALTMFMLKNNIKHGFDPVIPPYMVNEHSLEVSGNFPKFRDQVYAMPADGLYMSPTSEVNLASMYRDHIFMTQDLPIRMTAWSSCFRREAGGYGSTERGLIRIHQFEKVELYTICTPENSKDEQDRMIASAEDILQQLGLHYRISLLAAQDCSFQSAKTYDVEVWLPGQKAYYEVSSISNCTDFQARRGLLRFKITPESKTELVNTLNGSSLALPRLMVALMETYQQADGSIAMPEILKKEGIF